MANASSFIPLFALAATVALTTGAPAFAQSKSNPIEITDCTEISGVTEETHYVLTTDLTDCEASTAYRVQVPYTVRVPYTVQVPYALTDGSTVYRTETRYLVETRFHTQVRIRGYRAAILVSYNTGRVIIDLNGRTLSGGPGLARTGIQILYSPNASVKGNYHSRSDSGTWGATISNFRVGLDVAGSDDVSIGHSGVANGGIYVNDNRRGLEAWNSDRLYLNHMAFSRSEVGGAQIHRSDSLEIRALNFNPLEGTGLALFDSPNATIWGSSGRTQANTYGLALYQGSDDAVITSWRANRSYLSAPDWMSAEEPAGIYVAADGVELEHGVFNKTGSPNTCDLYIDAAVTDLPTISGATVYQRSSNDVTICEE